MNVKSNILGWFTDEIGIELQEPFNCRPALAYLSKLSKRGGLFQWRPEKIRNVDFSGFR